MNSPSSKISRTSSRSSLYGEINAVIAIVPASTSNLLTSPIRRMFSLRSSGLNPKFLFKPCRTLSPSNRYECLPFSNSAFSSATEIVDLPEPDKPVNQMTALL